MRSRFSIIYPFLKRGVLVRLIAIFALICSMFHLASLPEAKAEELKAAKFESSKDSVSYVVGSNLANSLMDIKNEINLEMLINGLEDKFQGKSLLVTEEESQKIMSDFVANIRNKQNEEKQKLANQNLEQGNKFFEENKKQEGVVTTESGLQFVILKQGDGPIPVKTDRVKTHYKGTTLDGTEFDSSYKRGTPATFPVTGVIKGWTEALLSMKVGSKYKLFIPSELAYGERGAGKLIGPNAALIFDIELVSIEK
jgi:FKBP-type peptidyl-prolyl cis-trans isomerase